MIVREMYADRPRLAVERRQPDGLGRVGLLRRGPSAISLGQLDPNDDHLVWMPRQLLATTKGKLRTKTR